jgi:hypothetical protein
MPARLTDAGLFTDVGDTWRGWLLVTDNDGVAASADTVTVALTTPAGTADTGTATAQTTTGVYLLAYAMATAGTYTFVVTVASTSFGSDVLAFRVVSRATSGAPPDASAVRAYLGDTSATDEEITDALGAETAAQARTCNVPADYPQDLDQALKRRVARNLAARAVPVATFTSFEGGGTSVRVPKLDAEITRLEAPYRRWVIA